MYIVHWLDLRYAIPICELTREQILATTDKVKNRIKEQVD